MEEIRFRGMYKGWSFSANFSLDGASNEDVAFALAFISEGIDKVAFTHAGIDWEAIKSTVESTDLNSLKPAKLRDALLKASADVSERLPVAECYFVRLLLEKDGVPYKLLPSMVKSKVEPKEEEFDDQIVFIGNVKGWFCVKKMTVAADTAPWEVAAILSSINNTLVKKAFFFAGVKEDAVLLSKIVGGKKRSLGNLAEVVKLAKSNFTADTIRNAWLVKACCEAIGYRPWANTEMLVKEHPELKELKGIAMRGRKPKG